MTSWKVRQMEADFRWVMIGSILLSFNKESITYLNRAHSIVSLEEKEDCKDLTVLHLGFGKTIDNGLRVYNFFLCLVAQQHLFEALCFSNHNIKVILWMNHKSI